MRHDGHAQNLFAQDGAAFRGAGGGLGHSRASIVGVNAIVAAKTVLCRTLWMQGETARALEEASDAVARARTAGRSVSLRAQVRPTSTTEQPAPDRPDGHLQP